MTSPVEPSPGATATSFALLCARCNPFWLSTPQLNEHTARQFPSCPGRNTTCSSISAFFLAGHVFKVCARTSGTQGLCNQGKYSGQLVCNVGVRSKRVSGYVCTHTSTVDPAYSIAVACGERQSPSPLRPSVADVRAAGASGGHRGVSGHCPRGSEQEVTHDKGTPGPQTPPCPHVLCRLSKLSFKIVAETTKELHREPPPLILTTRTSNRTFRMLSAAW